MIKIVYLFALIIVSSCVRNDDSIITLSLDTKLNKEEIHMKDCPVFEIASITGLSDLPLQYPRVVYVDDSLYGIVAHKSVYFVDKITGKLKSDLTHVGRGPSEYLFPFEVAVDDGVVLVTDNPSVGKVISYSICGDYLRTDSIPEQSMMFVTGKGGRVLVYSNKSDKDVEVYYNGILKHSLAFSNGPEDTGNTYMSGAIEYGGEIYVKSYFSDVIYRVSDDGIHPFLRMNKGNKSMPYKYYATVDSYSTYREKYITDEFLRICGDYAFVTYVYKYPATKEIWKISDSKLLYRVVEGKTPEPQGIPVEINGKTLAFWPQYCHGNDLYSVIEDGDVSYVVQLKISD